MSEEQKNRRAFVQVIFFFHSVTGFVFIHSRSPVMSTAMHNRVAGLQVFNSTSEQLIIAVGAFR